MSAEKKRIVIKQLLQPQQAKMSSSIYSDTNNNYVQMHVSTRQIIQIRSFLLFVLYTTVNLFPTNKHSFSLIHPANKQSNGFCSVLKHQSYS